MRRLPQCRERDAVLLCLVDRRLDGLRADDLAVAAAAVEDGDDLGLVHHRGRPGWAGSGPPGPGRRTAAPGSRRASRGPRGWRRPGVSATAAASAAAEPAASRIVAARRRNRSAAICMGCGSFSAPRAAGRACPRRPVGLSSGRWGYLTTKTPTCWQEEPVYDFCAWLKSRSRGRGCMSLWTPTRRRFLRTTALATGAALAAPYVKTAHSAGKLNSASGTTGCRAPTP